MACKVKQYDREDRTTGFHAMDTTPPMPWKAQFIKWCGLRFEERHALTLQLDTLLFGDPTGAGFVPGEPYGILRRTCTHETHTETALSRRGLRQVSSLPARAQCGARRRRRGGLHAV